MSSLKLHKSCAISVVLATIVGCGDGRPTRVPIAGQVLIDGKPLSHGQVMFVSSTGRPSQGTLDENGRFHLSCYEENDGALLGSHKVAVTAAEGISNTQTRWFAPKKYSDYHSSGLVQEVTGPTDNLIINISWEGGREFVELEQGDGGDEGMQGKRGQKIKPAE